MSQIHVYSRLKGIKENSAVETQTWDVLMKVGNICWVHVFKYASKLPPNSDEEQLQEKQGIITSWLLSTFTTFATPGNSEKVLKMRPE